jgi:lambda repressor-like predicted transcriptional regulator
MVCHVIAGRKRNARVEQVIADEIGMGYQELWEA